MATDFRTLIEEIKTSLRLTTKNVVSYFLAGLGLIVVMAMVMIIVVIPIMIAFVGTDPMFWAALGTNLATAFSQQPILAGILAVIVTVPIATLIFTLIGTYFGMGRELLENNTTHAETAFSFLRYRGLALAGAGLILSLVIVTPPILVWTMIAITTGQTTGMVSAALGVFSFIWVFITVGLLLNVFPSIAKGNGVQNAVIESIQLARSHTVDVFGTLSTIVVMILVTIFPGVVTNASLSGTYMWMTTGLLGTTVAVWFGVACILWFLILFPMTTIVITRLYHSMVEGPLPSSEQTSIPII